MRHIWEIKIQIGVGLDITKRDVKDNFKMFSLHNRKSDDGRLLIWKTGGLPRLGVGQYQERYGFF